MPNSLLPSNVVRPLPDRSPHPYSEYDQNNEWIDGEQLREYWQIIFKHRTLIAACLLVFLAGGLLYCFTATPLYTAEAKIRIGSYDPVLVGDIEEMLQQKSKEQLYLDTQIQEIESLSVADRVLSDKKILSALQAQERKGFLAGLFAGRQADSGDAKGVYAHSVRHIKAYLDRVSVKPIRRTSLVTIEATSEQASLAAYTANKHAEEYIRWVRDVRIGQQSRGLKFLQQQASELRTKLSDLEREIADYAEEHSIVALNKDENIIVQKMARLNELLTEATAKRIEAENDHKKAADSLAERNTAFDDQSVQTMQTELARLEAQYGELSAKFTDSYPKMQQLRSQIEGLKGAIAGHRESIIKGLAVKAAAAKEEENRISEELEQQKSRAFELSKKQVQYNILNREADSTRELLQNVLRQMKETSLSVESNASNVSIVDHAVLPLAPSFPRKKLVMLLCAIVGGGIGLGLAFLLHHLDNSLHSPEQLSGSLHLPALGVVPTFEEAGDPPAHQTPETGNRELVVCKEAAEPIVFLRNPKALSSEAYRTIRTAILLSQAGQPPRSILITSAQAGEGKTSLSTNLAVSLASSGGRVVLVDADLRRPSVWKYFNKQRVQSGLVEILTGQARLDDVCLQDPGRNISILLSGRIPPNPAELLGSPHMHALLQELSCRFDYVIIDSPPVLPVTDSVILSRFVDGVVLVVKGGDTPAQVALDAKTRLRDVGAKLLGAVLNNVDLSGNDYHYYNKYYYSYYAKDSEAKHKGRRLLERWKEKAAKI